MINRSLLWITLGSQSNSNQDISSRRYAETNRPNLKRRLDMFTTRVEIDETLSEGFHCRMHWTCVKKIR